MNVAAVISIARDTRRAELAGAGDGAAWYRVTRTQLDAVERGAFVLDFSGIRIATVSWLREAIVTLVRYAGAMKPELVVVAANLTELVREELQVALEATGTVLIVATFDGDQSILSPVLIGHLDASLRETLQAIAGQATVDAPYVSKSLSHVGASAANNRLAALEAKRILKSHRRGRSRVYSPVLEGLSYGH